MGQYKVPQNVESEDKIIGPLTFKQFIYALIGLGWGIVCFALLHKFVPLMIAAIAPVTLLFMLLAFYQRDGQNFEQLLIAMVGYFSQSRKRIWRKEELAETYKVTPKPVAAEHTQRSAAEVRSQLEQLGTMIDSRGWNRPTETEVNPELTMPAVDRLVVSSAATVSAPAAEAPFTDMLETEEGPLAQNLSQLLDEAAEDVREEAIEQMMTPSVAVPRPAAAATTQTPENILKLATDSDDISVSQLAANATRMAPLQPGQAVELRHG